MRGPGARLNGKPRRGDVFSYLFLTSGKLQSNLGEKVCEIIRGGLLPFQAIFLTIRHP